MAGDEGPIPEFCAGLRQLQQERGLSRTELARRVNYSRSQLYAILDGQIRRPPEWSRLVEPLVRACTNNNERSVALWRRRHEVLVELYRELQRRTRPETETPAALYQDISVFTEQERLAPQPLVTKASSLINSPTEPSVTHDVSASTLPKVGFRKFSPSIRTIVTTILIMFSLLATYLFWSSFNENHSDTPVATFVQPGHTPTVRYCAYVIKEPAGVYPAPDASSKPIKFKYINDRVVIGPDISPLQYWIIVRTPQDKPGFNWMQTDFLGNHIPC